jgi:hypothetical protein
LYFQLKSRKLRQQPKGLQADYIYLFSEELEKVEVFPYDTKLSAFKTKYVEYEEVKNISLDITCNSLHFYSDFACNA